MKCYYEVFTVLLPIIDDLLAHVTVTRFMSTLDFISGYFYIAMISEDVEKSAFIIKNGCFIFHSMPFCLSRTPATFQKSMESISRLVLVTFIHVYHDITTSLIQEYLSYLKHVLTLLQNAGLT